MTKARKLLIECMSRIVLVDSFDRTDSASGLGKCDTGQWWQSSGTFGISSGKAIGVSSYALVKIDCGIINRRVSVDVTFPTGGDLGIVARLVDGTNYTYFDITPSNIVIGRRLPEGWTTLGQYSNATVVGRTYKLTVENSADRMIFFLDGTKIIDILNGDFGTSTLIGIRVGNTVLTGLFNNLVVEAI
jgi:hypothetical protein